MCPSSPVGVLPITLSSFWQGWVCPRLRHPSASPGHGPSCRLLGQQPEPADVRQGRGASPQRKCCPSPRVHMKGRQVEESMEERCGFLHWDDSKGVFLPAGRRLHCGGAGMKHKEEGMTYCPCLPWNHLVQVPRKPGATTGLCCSRPPSPSLISVCSRTTGGRAQALALPRSLTRPLTSHRAL